MSRKRRWFNHWTALHSATDHEQVDLTTRKTEPFLSGISGYSLSANGEKILYRMGPASWFIAATAAAPKPGEGALKLDDMQVYSDPRAEWAQMYHEVWRIERDSCTIRTFMGWILPQPKRNTRLRKSRRRPRRFESSLYGNARRVTIGHMFIFGETCPRRLR